MRSGIRVVGTVAVTLLALSACGATDDTPPDDLKARAASPHAPNASRPTDAPETPTSQAGGDGGFNVTGGDWPGDLRGADALYKSMPATFKTWRVQQLRGEGGSAGVFYGSPDNNGAVAYSMEASKEIPDARSLLSAMFGMGMVCDKATYRGTAKPMQGGLGPGLGSGGGVEPWWFACQTKSTDSGGRPFVLGWTSGEVGWLVSAPDEDTARELLDVMVARSR